MKFKLISDKNSEDQMVLPSNLNEEISLEDMLQLNGSQLESIVFTLRLSNQ